MCAVCLIPQSSPASFDTKMAYSQIDATVAAAIGRERRNNRIQLAVVSLGLLLVQAAFSGGAPSAVGSSGGA